MEGDSEVNSEEADVATSDAAHHEEPAPAKQARYTCIFDCGLKDSNLVSLRDKESWDSLVNAAKLHKHNAILRIAAGTGDNEVPTIMYHRKCRSVFTMKKTLQRLSQGSLESHSSEPIDTDENRRILHRRSSVGSSDSSRVYKPICIFCQKRTRYIKKSNSREPLVQCAELRSDASIRQAATEKNDVRVIALVSRDLVAAEGHYHRSCYRAYTRPDKTEDIHTESSEDFDQYSIKEKLCLDKLFAFVRDELFAKPQVVRLTDLTEKLSEWLLKEGVCEVKLSTKKHILRKLNVDFGDSLHILHDLKGKVLLYPETLTIAHLVRENQALKEELKNLKQKSSTIDKEVQKVEGGGRVSD